MAVSAHFSALDDEEFFAIEGSGWRGRWESDSQVFCHPNSVHFCGDVDKLIVVGVSSAPPPQGSDRLLARLLIFFLPLMVDMPLHGGHAAGAAMRRRQHGCDMSG